ncbi:MAG TPA: hypothetical protein VFN77_01540 [Acetobacteraceae bacterium]|nr:hypothetical protein [Acetobacteraceae bacterium]
MNHHPEPVRSWTARLGQRLILALALASVSGACRAETPRPEAGAASIASTGIVPLSDAAMAETVARGAQSPAAGVPAGGQPAITLWDEVKPLPQPAPASGSVTVTLNGLPAP